MNIEKKILRPGDGQHFPLRGQTITIHYTGAFTNKTVFDSSRHRNQVYRFRLGLDQTIKAFDIFYQMSLREHVVIKVPWQLAYGELGLPNVVPPKTDVMFDLELLKID
ncbi:Peptidylprolyl_isomerase [Hexamita inflata]|uniref:peptidylprolyl isomerase n=1 Tax=Hexamita inflata TaxID=28002 RepID=A0AA86P3B7_9EUKA|nr:Peptidylprolyl isomerase [Hexamita inflata]CAI9933751.1 Peptidylprolyl isomerase [Hexamita inflata]